MNPLLDEALKNYETMANSTALNQTYRETIKTYLTKMTIGDELSAPSAMRQAVRTLTEQGIMTIDHVSGRKVRMDTMVRNSLMTEFTNIVQDVQNRVAEEVGFDGVEVSIHSHSAPDHEPFQGHTFTNAEFEKLQNGDIAEDIDGEKFQTERPIGMWNCRHLYFGVLIGISEPSMNKRELEFIKGENTAGVDFNGKHYTLYQAEQLQRRLETEIRRQKETSNLFKQVKKDNPEFNKDYQESVRRTLGLQMGYGKLGKALEPHAIRTKWDRSFVIRDKQGNVPMVLQGALSDRQIAERADIASRVAKGKYKNENFIKASSINPQLKYVSLPHYMENIYISENRLKSLVSETDELIFHKEIIQAKVFSDIGNTVYLSPDNIYGKKTIDGFINGWETEFKTITGTANKVNKRYRNAIEEKKATNVFIRINNPAITRDMAIHQIRLVLKNNPNYFGRIIVQLAKNQSLFFLSTDDLR